MIVAIHQPNFLPWQGYFHKILKADAFIFLDDVQYSKNNIINRVKILQNGAEKWLTLPVSYQTGQAIHQVTPNKQGWQSSQLDSLKQFYRKAPAFRQVFPDIQALYADLPETDLAAINMTMIERLSGHLGLNCRFLRSSEMGCTHLKSDDRLIALIRQLGEGGVYFSGRGAAKYQDLDKFAEAGIPLKYTSFSPLPHDQMAEDFLPGLSILDAVFHLGWSETARLLANEVS